MPKFLMFILSTIGAFSLVTCLVCVLLGIMNSFSAKIYLMLIPLGIIIGIAGVLLLKYLDKLLDRNEDK